MAFVEFFVLLLIPLTPAAAANQAAATVRDVVLSLSGITGFGIDLYRHENNMERDIVDSRVFNRRKEQSRGSLLYSDRMRS
ncbi:hypothetical protein CEXT_219751 [Caerostris extrusa]|uniref:Uncharacterized protein n=1 Tax=Caerostris extrusa TaxID=172846 RepID=A0AAV4QQ21_CAEEX|nr:hypothetical protein CEXT_219751 [Caerostris extrusa]